MSPRNLVPLTLLCVCCTQQQDTTSTRQPTKPLPGVQQLVDQGRLDEALAEARQAPQGAESLYYQGLVWAKKAEALPPPTPMPAPASQPRGAQPPRAPEFKDEELRALDFFERAIAESAEYSAAQLALANLLAPHAIKRFDEHQAAAEARPAGAQDQALPQEVLDFGPDRVLQAYQVAVRTSPESQEAVACLARFAARVERLEQAEAAHLELLKRQPEQADPIIAYGDFLVESKLDPRAGIERYREALIWKPDDARAKAKIAAIYIKWGEDHYSKRENVPAERNFLEAKKYVTDWSSAEGRLVQQRLESLRRRRR